MTSQTMSMTAQTTSMTAPTNPVVAAADRIRSLVNDRTPAQRAAFRAEHNRVSQLLESPAFRL